jgi:hypothetical protein
MYTILERLPTSYIAKAYIYSRVSLSTYRDRGIYSLLSPTRTVRGLWHTPMPQVSQQPPSVHSILVATFTSPMHEEGNTEAESYHGDPTGSVASRLALCEPSKRIRRLHLIRHNRHVILEHVVFRFSGTGATRGAVVPPVASVP